MKNFIHKEAADGKWFHMPLAEQLGNIGSEVGRSANTQGKDGHRFHQAVERALDLFDLTMEDKRWIEQKRLREIARVREVFCDAAYNRGKEYNTSLADLDKYFLQFAIAARRAV